MKYTLWYACYIDLLREEGVGASFIEHEGNLQVIFQYYSGSTINKLNLLALLNGLTQLPAKADVDIYGNSKYISEVLRRIGSWIKKDEIDIKSHSDLLKSIWNSMILKRHITTEYYTSRKSHPMLWATSKAVGNYFRLLQESVAKNAHPVKNGDIWKFDIVSLDDFLRTKFQAPLTDLALEKLISSEKSKRLAADKQEGNLNNVIPLRLVP